MRRSGKTERMFPAPGARRPERKTVEDNTRDTRGSAAGNRNGAADGIPASASAGIPRAGAAAAGSAAAGTSASASAGILRAGAAAAHAVIDMVYPRRCPVCDRPVRPSGALICPECEPLLERVREPVCRRCGKPVRGPGVQFCADCRSLTHVYERGCAVFTYHSAAGGLFRFKYRGRQEYSAYYGACMADRLVEFAGDLERAAYAGRTASAYSPAGRTVSTYGPAGQGRTAAASGSAGSDRYRRLDRFLPDLLVPVPISAGRLQKRGYNQALLLARQMSEITGIPVREDVLRRVTDTLPMKNMSPQERQNNLKKAFQAYGNDVELNSIMLIDDIYTTGATIDACAHALYRQGARRVFFMALAIGGER